ncbi:hypothetical protein BUALT_Bualt07G0076300 [Buddleja alternifolia]|uniref:TF-B3 domain-containing protein n=1 Tax=Buddleja alternifolia TaxID=168488 RepID=A0AAV6XH17_9LAMI|nr:hypothetical protein BUALT_Bualt07G0076300 [Buddleja alternifolia]
MEGKHDAVVRHFFKVMMPGFQETLILPPAFCQKLKQEEPDEAIVATPKGMWKIEVRKNHEGLICFKEGWPNFVHHHSLNVGDFIVFEYMTGHMHFKASVFDPTACEKQFTVLELEKKSNNAPQRAKPNYCPKNTNKKPIKDSVVSHNDENAHFVLTMKPHNACQKMPRMGIPVEFLRSNDLSERTRLSLRDPCGKIWAVKLLIQTSGQYRGWIGRGWHEFYISNKLKNGDVCHFELHRHSHRPNNVVMDVQIFPTPV